jgi:predicted methyltransferase
VVILHTFLALVAGFAVTILLAMGLTALVARLAPGWRDTRSGPSKLRSPADDLCLAGCKPGALAGELRPGGWGPAGIFVNLGSSFLAAAAGGYVTAWVAAANPLIHVGVVVLALSALSALQERGRQPVGYQLAQVAISPIGVLAGGLVRLRMLGIL